MTMEHNEHRKVFTFAASSLKLPSLLKFFS